MWYFSVRRRFLFAQYSMMAAENVVVELVAVVRAVSFVVAIVGCYLRSGNVHISALD